MDNKTYFAALPSVELAPELQKRVEAYYMYLETSGMLRKLRKSYDLYYGYSASGYYSSTSDVGYGGEQGELAMVKVNHYRSLVNHLLVLTTQNRPALEPRASNSDMKSQAQTMLASGILDYYMRDKRLERNLRVAAEHALVWGEGYVHVKWNVNLGEPVAVDPTSQQQVKEGDLEFSNPLGPLEVIKDISLQSGMTPDWYIVRELINKYDLAAQYPMLAEQILAVQPTSSTQNNQYQSYLPTYADQDSPLIPQYTLYHRKTPAMQDGRQYTFLTPDLWLNDSPIVCDRLPGGLPLYRITPAEFFGSPFGYSSCWDMIGLSEIIDSLYSVVTTNQTTFGVQNILVPEGHNLSFQQLAGNLNLLEYNVQKGKPEALQLTKTPPEIFNFIKSLEDVSQLLVGINNVVRGQPEASLKSGSALALMASQAIQFNSGLAGAYAALLEDVGTAVIKMLQTFSNTKRVASIAGKANLYQVKEFEAEDLDTIDRVVVDVANPLSRTTAGRLEMAQNLLQVPGLLKSPEQYLQVVNTGKLEIMTEAKTSQLMKIKQENERMSEGQTPQAVLVDQHAMHIEEHAAVLASPGADQDPNVVNTVMAHIQQHIDLLRNTDPGLLMVLGQQPLPPLPPPPPPMGPDGQPMPPPGAPQPPPPGGPRGPAPQDNGLHKPAAPHRPDGAPAAPTLDATNPIVQQTGKIADAQMPKIAGTNQRFNPAGQQ